MQTQFEIPGPILTCLQCTNSNFDTSRGVLTNLKMERYRCIFGWSILVISEKRSWKHDDENSSIVFQWKKTVEIDRNRSMAIIKIRASTFMYCDMYFLILENAAEDRGRCNAAAPIPRILEGGNKYLRAIHEKTNYTRKIRHRTYRLFCGVKCNCLLMSTLDASDQNCPCC